MRNNKPTPIHHRLTLNTLEIIFNKDKLSLQKAIYSEELYNEYKRKQDFFIYRFGDYLYIWELRPTNESLPSTFKEAEITIKEHASIFRKIVESAIVQCFRNNNREIIQNRYSPIWEVKLQNEKQKNFNALSLHPILAFSLINLYPTSNRRQIIALSLRRRLKPVFNENDETTKNQLANIHGLKQNHIGEIKTSIENQYRYLESIAQKQNYLHYKREMESPRSEFEFIKKYTESFKEITSKLYMPNDLEILNFLPVNLPNASFKSIKIRKPQYFYYNERTKDGYPNKVISDLKPYSSNILSNKKLDILVVSPNQYKGSINRYIPTLERKLQDIFHLKNVKFHLNIMGSGETYTEALDKIDANSYHLAIILISKKNKELPTYQSPYYLTKAKLLNQRLLTQELTIEVIRENKEIVYNDIALNIYSKLGGTGWTIEKSEKNIPELIIGIGSTVDDNGERIIGFANVFDYNGTYLVGDCSQLSTMDTYTKNLENHLIDTLRNALNKKGLSERNEIRLIFHLFKEASKEHELAAIDAALKHFKGYDIHQGLVHLSYGHNLRAFKGYGQDYPDSGTFIQLAPWQALLFLGGKSVVPIQIRLDRRSEYKDIYTITKQVFYLTHLSHRSFIYGGKPVTIKYSNLMAKMVSELKKVPYWDPSILNKLNEELWFI